MPCYHPIPAWYAKRVNPKTGKRGIVFNLNDGYKDRPVDVPCGGCIGCRLERARQWAVRCMHETKLHESNLFVTLTYEDAKLPLTKFGLPTLNPRDMVLFLKRLREKKGEGIRFFQCGEYGEQLGRPHHHALLFNCSFADSKFHTTAGDATLYVSEELNKLWGHGHCTVGEATFESAGYIARYTLKKVDGPAADVHYSGREPEYLTMSRRPGIGRGWAEKNRRDWYPSDSMIVNGVPCRPPRFYDNICEKEAPSLMRRVKAKRRREAAADVDNTGKRLVVREAVKQAAITTLKRDKAE